MNVKNLPKIELHRHLELCWRHSTLLELAPEVGLPIRKPEDLKDELFLTEPMHDLQSALKKFLNYQRLLVSPALLERMAYEAVEDAFLNENIRALELRYAPTFVQQANPKMTFDTIHAAINKGLQRVEAKYPVATGLICIIQRTMPLKVAEEVAEFAIANKKTFLALDLADNEDGFDCKPFAPLFEKAKAAGLHVTIHAGEINSPRAPQSVLDAIEYLGAERIGHGLQIYKDPKAMQFVKSKNITLELCPTSNYLTNAVTSLAKHPFRQLMNAGIRTTINTDDPTPFCTDLNREFEILNELHQFGEKEFQACFQNAKQASFIPAEKLNRVF